MQNVAFSRCCFVAYCKQGQRNEHRIITHAYKVIVLFGVVIKVNFLKSNKRPSNEQPNEHKANKCPAE